MRDQIVGRLQSLQRSFAAFTAGQKTIAVIGGLALVLGAVMVFRWASTPTYAPLFTNMAPADASAVVDKLNAAGTPYKLSDGGGDRAGAAGRRVLLPHPAQRRGPAQPGLGRLRDPRQAEPVDLAVPGADHLQAGHRGRAGEAPSRRSTPSTPPSCTSRCRRRSCSPPTRSPPPPRSSSQTHPGVTLGSQQVQAIVHLVASSVEGLDPKQVTVTDSAGTVLSAAGDGIDSVADTRAQQVKSFEDRMQRLGRGRAHPHRRPGQLRRRGHRRPELRQDR